MRWKFGLFWCGARNSLFPELKLSRTVTLFSSQQSFYEMAADEAGAPGDEDRFVF